MLIISLLVIFIDNSKFIDNLILELVLSIGVGSLAILLKLWIKYQYKLAKL